MGRKLIQGVAVLALAVSAVVQAGVFTDKFETAHNYVTQGVTGTGWDGFVGLEAGETVDSLSASIDRPGQLYLASTNGVWSESWSPLGPFLYKIVRGDFIATVQVTDYAGTASSSVLYNNCGLMARAIPDDVGGSENWVSIDYFPLYGVGNIVRYATNNVRSEDTGGNGTAWNGDKYLQLQRVGNTFTLRTSADGVTWVDYPDPAFNPLNRPDLNGLAVQVGLHHATFSSNAGYAAFDGFRLEGPGVVDAGKQAYNPSPADGAKDVPQDKGLSWTPLATAVTRDVYLGTTYEDVNAASRANTMGVLVSQSLDVNTCDPAGLFAFGQTYYWRVDEVNAPPDSTVFKGAVWSFTAETYGYKVTPIKATASSSLAASSGPDKTIDGSGLNVLDEHSSTTSQMWLSKSKQTPIWIQYQFDSVYSLYQMWVWNSNQVVEPDIGYGAKDVKIETSLDGTTWTTLAGVPEFAQATGEPNYVHNTAVDFGGVQAKYVKLTINSNWGGAKSSGLSEVRFFYVPVVAREPQPASGSTGVALNAVLNWRPGRTAAKHEVYLTTDSNAVANGAALVTTVSAHRYALASLPAEYGRTYYWKVNEVNDAATPRSWEGPVWSLSTPDSLVVDDFEKYDDTCNRVYYAWQGGLDNSANVDCGVSAYAGNGTGSAVGNSQKPWAERTIIHGGRQSMPFFYDNTTGKSTSEAVRTFGAAQDWTQGGLKTLVLYFRGSSDNGAGQVYLKINGTRVDYPGNAAAIAMPLWKQWNIDLASVVGVSLKAVNTLTVGVSGSGEGVLYVDDIRLYRSAPAVVQPVDPGTAGLSAYYALDGDAKDGSGHGYNGTAMGNQTYADDSGYGKAIQLNGTDDYVDLPIGPLLSTLADATFTTRVNVSNASGGWQRIFDFGMDTNVYMFLTPTAGSSGAVRFAITTTGGGGESVLNASASLTGWHHVAVAFEGASKTMRLYVDGDAVASGSTGTLPKDLGKTTQNWLGRSQYSSDAYFTGLLDEFRIYNRALSAGEIRYLAGDRQ